MPLSLGLALYFIIWWLVLFTVLPIGVTTQAEDGEVVPGSAESAPIHPKLLFKAVLTTAIATVVFALVYYAVTHGLIAGLG